MRKFDFDGKTCVITGAASGIGAALALDLAARHTSLALVDRDEAGLAKVAAAARAASATNTSATNTSATNTSATDVSATNTSAADVSTHVVDLSDRGDRLDLAEQVLDRHGRVDLLINNAGVALGGQLHEVSLDDIDWLLEINLRAVIAITKAFLPRLMVNPGAHIANISSLFGLVAPPGQTAYATSKFAVRGFTEALRHEMARRGVGVTVVHPGGVKTNIAVNARIGAHALAAQSAASPAAPNPADEIQRARDQINSRLTLPPEKAAAQILDAIRRRKPRLVITGTAKSLDVLARLAPGRYWSIVDRLDRR